MKLELSDKQAEMLCCLLEVNTTTTSIKSASEMTRILYDLFCVLRKEVARKNCYPPSDTWHNPPLHTCRTEPLARVEP